MAKKKTKVVINEQLIKNDLKHYGDIFCKTVANEAKYYIWEFARHEIEGYYDEYTPIYYIPRTNQELNYSFQMFSEPSSKGYRGGIVFDNSGISHEKAGISEDAIEGYVWVLGQHGQEHRFGIIQQFVQGETIDGYTLPIEKIIARAKGKAQKGKYTMLHF